MKIVLQEGRSDCGVCCLLSIIRFYGGGVSLEYLREITNTNRDGVSAYNLIEASKSIGLDAYGVTGKLENIDNNNLPCIAHVNVGSNFQHFVVIYKISNNKVIIMDPAKGKRVLSLPEFRLMSTDNYIFIKYKKKLPILNNKKYMNHFILSYINKNKIILVTLSSILLNYLVLDIILSFNFKYIITFCINYHNSSNLLLISIVMVIISLLSYFINLINKRILFKIIFMFDFDSTCNTFKHLLLLPYYYYKNRTVGEVLSRFSDLSTIKNYLVTFISSFISDFISLIVFFIFIFNINKELSLFIIVYFFLCTFICIISNRRKKKLYKKVRLSEEAINSYIVESISNVDTTKSSHLEKRFIDKFSLKYKRFLNYNYEYLNYLDFYGMFLKLLENILLVITYGYGGYLIVEQKINLSDMIIFITFFTLSLRIINRMINLITDSSTFMVSLNRIEDIYSICREDFSLSYFFLPYDMRGNIKFNNLYYKIDNRVIFDNLNLEINYKDKVLLFGSSGSGKSTLFKMLLRYIDVDYSMISISDIDINHYHLDNIRKYITYVSSNELLFTDTIYNNICLYKEVSEEEFLKVIRICRVNLIFGEDINNYNSMLEENGFLLSSGERQRIILARSILRGSNIYIFDEAFGQIDIELTNKILNDLFDYLKDKTVIVISHRNNSKKYFNRILKLVDGKIYEK